MAEPGGVQVPRRGTAVARRATVGGRSPLPRDSSHTWNKEVYFGNRK